MQVKMRSLKASVLFAMVALTLVNLSFIELAKSQPPPPGLYLDTDKTYYTQGEDVVITFINLDYGSTVNLAARPAIDIFDANSQWGLWILVWPAVKLPSPLSVDDPGKEEWIWNQEDYNGIQVRPGKYVVRLLVYDVNWDLVASLTEFFWIGIIAMGPDPGQPSGLYLDMDKTYYTEGEPVAITFINLDYGPTVTVYLNARPAIDVFYAPLFGIWYRVWPNFKFWVIVPVSDPGKEYWIWDQKDNVNCDPPRQVPPGRYAVSLKVYDEASTLIVELWEYFFITAPQYDDVVIGCLSFNGDYAVLGYRGTGNATTPQWERVEAWDIPNVPGDAPRASPCFADLDNDGDYDLLISNARFNYPPMGYKNIGNKTHPIWQRYSVWDVPSLGSYEQNPDLADLDCDGDYDLIVAGPHYAAFFENNGTAQSPSWKRRPDLDFNPGVEWPSPAFADLDNDGDYDLLFAAYTQGYCVAWENNGTIKSPSWTRKPAWDIPGLPPNTNKHMDLADLDFDGDYDAFVGVNIPYLNITAYENTGTPISPQWTRKPTWDIKTPEMASMTWIRPAFANLDGIHDVAVRYVRVPAREVYPGWPIKFTIHNGGNYPEMCNVTAYLDDTEVGAKICLVVFPDLDFDDDIPELDIEENVTLYVNYTLRVEVSPVPGETNLANNIYIYGTILIKLVGDVNCDRKVDMKDIYAVAKGFGKTVPPANVQLDIIYDGKIDMKDVYAAVRNFGKYEPLP